MSIRATAGTTGGPRWRPITGRCRTRGRAQAGEVVFQPLVRSLRARQSRAGARSRGQDPLRGVCPPSLHRSGRRYEWISGWAVAPAPGWLAALLTPPPPKPIVLPWGGDTSRADDGLVRFLAGLEKGGRRNCALFYAACRAHDRGGDPVLLGRLRAVAIAWGHRPSRVESTLRSAARAAGRVSAW